MKFGGHDFFGCLSGTLAFRDLCRLKAIVPQMALLAQDLLRSVKVKEWSFPSRSVEICPTKECFLNMFHYGVLNYVPSRSV